MPHLVPMLSLAHLVPMLSLAHFVTYVSEQKSPLPQGNDSFRIARLTKKPFQLILLKMKKVEV